MAVKKTARVLYVKSLSELTDEQNSAVRSIEWVKRWPNKGGPLEDVLRVELASEQSMEKQREQLDRLAARLGRSDLSGRWAAEARKELFDVLMTRFSWKAAR